jgi:uncharacterized coiled-coil protein SlyX
VFWRRKGGDIMVIKKDLVIAILSTFCLTATLFMIMPTRSQQPYDPWWDTNDDGIIDTEEMYGAALRFGALGDPINKTALLYEVNATFTELLSKIANLEARANELETSIVDLNASLVEQQSRIAELETVLSILNATKLGKPDWDSLDTYGWISIPAGEFRILTHNLQTTNVIVYMVGYDFDGHEFHQIDYGGEKNGLNEYGARWEQLTTTTITVTRFGMDQNWDLIRVMIWKIPEP